LKEIESKTIAIVFIVLMLSITILTMDIPAVQAQSSLAVPVGGPIPTGVTPSTQVDAKAYMSFRPNPVGVGQTFLVNLWVTPAPGAGRFLKDYTVTITKPDGKQDTVKMDSYVADGTSWFEYAADQAGQWTLKFDFPGTYLPAGNYSLATGAYMATSNVQNYPASAYYKPSSTITENLTVTTELAASWPPAALPTDYWTRPVAFEHREWWTILGDTPWRGPGGGSTWDSLYPNTDPYWNPGKGFTPWSQGPSSAHVVWKRVGDIGGVMGAGFKQENYIWPNVGYTYNEPTIIFQGRCYGPNVKVMPITVNGTVSNIAVNVWESYDLRTGQVYWQQTGVPEPTVIEYGTGTAAVPGVTPKFPSTGPSLLYIGSGRMIKYSPFTGAITLNVSVSPLTTGTYYMNGFALSVQDLGSAQGAANRYRLINWTTTGTSNNFADRIYSNISYAISNVPSTTDYNVGIACTISGITVAGSYEGQNLTAVSLITGKVLWSKTNDEPVYSGSSNVADHGKVADLSAKGYYLGYDLTTGTQLWKTETMDYPWDEPGFGAYGVESAYGMFFRNAYSGVYAFSWTDGKIVWKYEQPAVFNTESEFTNKNSQYSVYPFNAPSLIADGKMYIYNAEHSPDSPQNRGWRTHCINITTGEQIWSVNIAGAGWFGGTSAELQVSDGYLTLGGADGIMYVFGRGLTTTTVTASPSVVNNGATVLIEGKVMDQSLAQPNTPCVSKQSMATQMVYLHKQLPITGVFGNETIIGVPVTLTAIGSDGSVTNIGTVTTNGYYGTFSQAWTPPKQDTYTITATFAADDSYGSSAAATAVVVNAGAQPSATVQPAAAATDYSMTIIGTGLAIAIAVIVAVAIATVLILRKR
jgi:hypothetical protein